MGILQFESWLVASGLYPSLMCALGHPSAISGMAQAASESNFILLFWPKRCYVRKSNTTLNLPHGLGKKMNLVLCWEIFALVADNLLWYLCLIEAVCNISKLLVLQVVWSGTNGPHCSLVLPKQQPGLPDWLLVLQLSTAAHFASAAGGIKTLFFPCVTRGNFRPTTFWHLLLRRKWGN